MTKITDIRLLKLFVGALDIEIVGSIDENIDFFVGRRDPLTQHNECTIS